MMMRGYNKKKPTITELLALWRAGNRRDVVHYITRQRKCDAMRFAVEFAETFGELENFIALMDAERGRYGTN